MNQLSKRSSLQHKTSVNSSSSKHIKQQQPQKHKGILKHQKIVEEKPSRHNLVKADKRSHKNRNSSERLKQSQVQRAFSLHRTAFINSDQCLFSLRMLGCLTQEEGQTAKVKSLIRQRIDFQQFQDIYARVFKKEHLQNTRQLFNLISRQKPFIQTQNLQQIAKIVGWQGNAKDLLPSINGSSSLSFEQFNRIINCHHAVN